jgi:hypothetical protein
MCKVIERDSTCRIVPTPATDEQIMREREEDLSESGQSTTEIQEDWIVRSHANSAEKRSQNLAGTSDCETEISPAPTKELSWWNLREWDKLIAITFTAEKAAPKRKTPMVKGAKGSGTPRALAASGPIVYCRFKENPK